ncbi:MAG: ABC transporter permease [Actinobacteria bacterium]|nr:ABC transporter permease [Actinomycetota bacterium]
MHAEAAGFRAGWADARLVAALRRLASGVGAMGWAELRKLRHDNLDIATRSVQPLLWLFIFGTALRRNRALSGGYHDYRAYLAPGIMAQAALFIAIFFGLAVIWERDVGQLQRLLATPLPRLAIVLGKSAGAGIRALAQAVVLLAVLAATGISLKWSVGGVLGALVLLVLATGGFACLSMILASLVRTRERFMGDRADGDDAALLRVERALPPVDHARVAARRRTREPAHLRGARHAATAARRVDRRDPLARLPVRRCVLRRRRRDRGEALPARDSLGSTRARFSRPRPRVRRRALRRSARAR